MIERPHDCILDRTWFPERVNQHFAENLELLRELVNYGTNLMPRCLASSPAKIDDVIVLVSMTKYAICLLDAIELQAAQSAVNAAFVSLRSLWEMELYLEWVLQRDTKRRATMYLVFELRQQRKWARAAIAGTEENRKLKADLDDCDLTVNIEKYDATAIAVEIRNIDGKLSTPECASVNEEFERREASGKRSLHWYCLDGAENIRELARSVNREWEYVILYRGLCKATHGQVFHDQVRFDADRSLVNFAPVRDFTRLGELLRMSYNFTMRLYRLVLGHYRPEELVNFNRKYREEWRQRFLTVPEVTFDGSKYKIAPGNLS